MEGDGYLSRYLQVYYYSDIPTSFFSNDLKNTKYVIMKAMEVITVAKVIRLAEFYCDSSS